MYAPRSKLGSFGSWLTVRRRGVSFSPSGCPCACSSVPGTENNSRPPLCVVAEAGSLDLAYAFLASAISFCLCSYSCWAAAERCDDVIVRWW